jgi:hypothetical protein
MLKMLFFLKMLILLKNADQSTLILLKSLKSMTNPAKSDNISKRAEKRMLSAEQSMLCSSC